MSTAACRFSRSFLGHRRRSNVGSWLAGLVCLSAVAAGPGCGGSSGGDKEPSVVEGTCQWQGGGSAGDAGSNADAGAGPDFLPKIGCTSDFQALASLPLDVSLPGARSVKVVLDASDNDTPYFQNSITYQIHFQFASTHLSGGTHPIISSLADFNATEYYKPDRRFILGSITYYEQPKVWALELAPYDTASVAMITKLYDVVKAHAFFGTALKFHPTSEALSAVAKTLPSQVPVITTDQLYAKIDFQPLTLGSGVGRLRFLKAADVDSANLSYQDLVVLDEAPNDISVVQGLITETFQTPLSHVNVLSQNRHTPNMGLRKAMTNATLRSFEGKLVELTVSASEWSMHEVSADDAQAFWNAHKPAPVTLPALDLTVKDILDIEKVTPDPPTGGSLREAIKKAVLAFGGKAAQYSILARIGADVPIKKAFGIPVYFYDQFMQQNDFYNRIDALLADSAFNSDPTTRQARLAILRSDMLKAPIDEGFQALLKAKLDADFPGQAMRFRTSTNSEDLDGFPCAGCYESHTGNPAKGWDDVLDAIRESYASTWLFRTFEERSYYGIAHKSVGMALLVHHNFADEEANGVAVTANPFDASGLDPAYYINVQHGGDAEVVHPPPGVSSDEFLYYFDQPNQPISFISHSSLIDPGTTVLTTTQTYQLGRALSAIHQRFSAAYGPAAGNNGWYAMDVELKFDDEADPGKPATLYIKQARPYPGRGQ